MAECQNCGHNNPDNSIYCNYCGQPVKKSNNTQEKYTISPKKPTAWLSIFLYVLVVIFVIGWLVIVLDPTKKELLNKSLELVGPSALAFVIGLMLFFLPRLINVRLGCYAQVMMIFSLVGGGLGLLVGLVFPIWKVIFP